MTADPAPESGSRETRDALVEPDAISALMGAPVDLRPLRDAVAADLDALAARIARLEQGNRNESAGAAEVAISSACPAPPALSDEYLAGEMARIYDETPGSMRTAMLAVLADLRRRGICR